MGNSSVASAGIQPTLALQPVAVTGCLSRDPDKRALAADPYDWHERLLTVVTALSVTERFESNRQLHGITSREDAAVLVNRRMLGPQAFMDCRSSSASLQASQSDDTACTQRMPVATNFRRR